jgi:enamine deaminase RidA (YjgF/YER057c/UK114 family)
VDCTDDFTEQPKVVNGCSDLLVAVFGDRGRRARAAIGVAALPSSGASVKVDMIVEIVDRDER